MLLSRYLQFLVLINRFEAKDDGLKCFCGTYWSSPNGIAPSHVHN